ncbi:MAG: RNA-binding protein [Saprospiraceae bacterium]|nr:RNA-binding protein [Saprospiraceae bacterium]
MTIFVKNLSDSVNEFTLESLFATYGEVLSAKVIYDRVTSESKGYAFVEMPNDQEANKAIEALNGKAVSGQELEVSEAEDRSKKFKIRF